MPFVNALYDILRLFNALPSPGPYNTMIDLYTIESDIRKTISTMVLCAAVYKAAYNFDEIREFTQLNQCSAAIRLFIWLSVVNRPIG